MKQIKVYKPSIKLIRKYYLYQCFSISDSVVTTTTNVNNLNIFAFSNNDLLSKCDNIRRRTYCVPEETVSITYTYGLDLVCKLQHEFGGVCKLILERQCIKS